MMYRAVGGAHQALAKTAGAALDALTAQLPAEETGTLVVIQNHRPDQFFSAEQQRRLSQLMQRWQSARDMGTSLLAAEQVELSELVDAEVEASGKRAAAVLAGLAK
jgi:FAD synthase